MRADDLQIDWLKCFVAVVDAGSLSAAAPEVSRSQSAVLFGYSEGGPMSILYAASHPERVQGLVIYSSYARRMRAPDYPWGFLPEERARYAAQLEQDWAFEADMHTMCPNADDGLFR